MVGENSSSSFELREKEELHENKLDLALHI